MSAESEHYRQQLERALSSDIRCAWCHRRVYNAEGWAINATTAIVICSCCSQREQTERVVEAMR